LTVESRVDALRALMDEQDIDAAVVSGEANFAYLTGYVTQSFAMRDRPLALLIDQDSASAIVGSAEAERFAAEAPHFDVLPYVDPEPRDGQSGDLDFGTAVQQQISQSLGRRRIARFGVELSLPAIPGLGLAYLQPLIRRTRSEIVDIAAPLRRLRSRKDGTELAALALAATTLARVYDLFAEQASPGMSERDLASLLRQAAARAGADQLRFALIVAGARNPVAGPPSDRIWRPGELLFVDAALTVDGYWADFSRHYAAVEPSEAQRRAYGHVVAATRAGRNALAAGERPAQVAAAIAAELPTRDGLSIGRFGHGIGLDLTEPPSVNVRDTSELVEGMTLCVEPVADFPGLGILIAEEMVAAADNRAPLLSPEFPAELPVLGR
jgi:Xaa-Pro dipeptidase